jgi:hypothetical protein
VSLQAPAAAARPGGSASRRGGACEDNGNKPTAASSIWRAGFSVGSTCRSCQAQGQYISPRYSFTKPPAGSPPSFVRTTPMPCSSGPGPHRRAQRRTSKQQLTAAGTIADDGFAERPLQSRSHKLPSSSGPAPRVVHVRQTGSQGTNTSWRVQMWSRCSADQMSKTGDQTICPGTLGHTRKWSRSSMTPLGTGSPDRRPAAL